ncbi:MULTISPECIES: phosphoenolpyruvate--protein phosphotransferase [unclassified Bosea (in: a-proteobacteria)]|uniref:phosphoenolpyruvate--protein phosphotransferase n=2 Tax=Bacteria TaxID=2 RepID=UPI000F75AE8C|nr:MULTISPECIES: phosphoenolpyruvate--protein phosphotransferase [unclassified Bosea (in: a-proteobacteria)]AZO78917.1 phosphoenolpyruvate--protein phosphotransferase [Bosea sp. Tri-49]RXT27696.1 phosphoenolpyruvate--protein phosphotransferase [Bosea sp. Tri-39]RXT35599.1 phosphoenolpyruvate--protein phosphotransferase [Bosea sp. Tri-54]
MRGALGGSGVLLRRLREVMAARVSPQERLDRLVVVIAGNLVAEVCSVYVLREDSSLELYATEGLNREAVHLTTMRAGEGLVGLIASEAEPLALSDAQSHPAFSYRPETGEEIYRSFLGVPILRGGAVMGVLVVQNRASRLYSEDEVESLQTTAMIMAEMIAAGGLKALSKPGATIGLERPIHSIGTTLADGVGLGHAVLHEPRVAITNLIAEDPGREVQRLEAAIATMRLAIDELIERGDVAHTGEHRDVLETFRMFAHDQGWLRRMREVVMTGLTAEAAVERVQSDTRAKMLRQTDPYLRERLHDLDDLANRLLRTLVGKSNGVIREDLPENAILIARSMGPAALLDYDRRHLRGVVLEEGGPTSHIAIVARALGIPAVGEIANATALIQAGDAVIVDGQAGEVQIRPQPDVENAYKDKARLRARKQEQYRKLKTQASVTKDGVEIQLQINAGLLVDMANLDETNASGVGLFRTELQFMVAQHMPTTAEQQALYDAVLKTANGRPVTFRTLDIGGDKVLPYMERLEEENPALGWRAIRIGLDRPRLLRGQVRALLRAGAGCDMKIMLPMIATVNEFLRARLLVRRELAMLERDGRQGPTSLKLGVMVEVPSLLFELPEIAREADFLSIGTNDLMQFLFAADRENKRVSDRFDPLSAAGLRALRSIVDEAGKADCPVTVCGEMGGKPIETLALIALGYRSFSMSAASVGPVKAMLRALDAGKARQRLDAWLGSSDGAASLRPLLAALAAEMKVPV